MSSPLETPPAPARSPQGAAEPADNVPDSWREGFMTLLSSRLAIIQLEGRDAARDGAKLAAFGAAALVCGFFTWVLLLAGGIALLADATGWHWGGLALLFALLHLVVGIVMAVLAKNAPGAFFPYTRAEFTKDRKWIENFSEAKKSND